MAASTPHTIAVEYQQLTRREAQGHEAITPGELLAFNSDEELIPHGSAAGVLAGKLVALESPTADSSTTAAIDVDYAADDTVYYAVGKPGDKFLMWLKSAEVTVRGITQLVSDGAGALQAQVVDANTLSGAIVGVAAEDKTAAGGVRARVLVEIV
jgi:hypothetical protein